MHENRETFFARLRPLMSPSDVRTVELAYTLAKFYHRAQHRREVDEDGDPVRYFEHARHVALILIDVAQVVEHEVVCAALLHDSLEDTRLTPEHIEQYFGSAVAQMVIRLSKLPKEGYTERLINHPDWRVILVKLCDRLHNLRTLPADDEAFQRKQIRETQDCFPHLFHAGYGIAPARDAQSLQMVFDAICRACHEWAARW